MTLTWDIGLCIFNFLFCMDFAKLMSVLHKLRPSSCLILDHKFLQVDPCPSFRSLEPYKTKHLLDFQNEDSSYPYFKFQKVSLPYLSSFKQNSRVLFHLQCLKFCRFSNRFERNCEALLKLSGNATECIRGVAKR